MRSMLVGVVITVVACGGGTSGGGDDLASVRDRLVEAGIGCDADPAPYVADENAIQIGDDPVEELRCTVDGVDIEFTRWESANDRGIAMEMGLAMACGFGAVEFSWLADGRWAGGTDGDSEADAEMLDRMAEALDAEPSTKVCE